MHYTHYWKKATGRKFITPFISGKYTLSVHTRTKWEIYQTVIFWPLLQITGQKEMNLKVNPSKGIIHSQSLEFQTH